MPRAEGRRRVAWAAAAGLALAAGCDDGADPCVPGPPVTLATVEAWQVASAAADPFADHRPAAPHCPDYALRLETHSLEVDTAACDYVTLVQPLAAAVAPCDHIELDLAHLLLRADGPATAHLAVAVGGQVLWSLDIPIPAPQAVYSLDLALPEGAAAGTPIAVHLHNHGENSWYVGDVRRRAP